MSARVNRPIAVGLIASASTLVACDDESHRRVQPRISPSSTAQPRFSLFSPKPLTDGFEALEAKAGTPVAALKVAVFPDRIVLQARNKKRPNHVDQYVFRSDGVGGPIPVKLKGTGTLEDNLFALREAKLDTIPALISRSIEAARVEDGQVTKVVLKRNLPKSMDLIFRVYIVGPRRDATIEADEDGTLLPERDE